MPSRALVHVVLSGLAAVAVSSLFNPFTTWGNSVLVLMLQSYVGDRQGAVDAASLFMLATIAAYPVAAIALWIWCYRTSRALKTQRRLKITPAWAVLWWFIPLANLYKPYEVMVELWRASDPDGDDHWALYPRSPILPLWWLCWIGGNVASSIAGRIAFGMAWRQTGETGADVGDVGIVMHIAAAALAGTIVYKIQIRGERLLAKARERSKRRRKRRRALRSAAE